VSWRFLHRQREELWHTSDARRGSFSLQLLLWTIWSLLVVAVEYISWRADFIAYRPINTVGLVVHCVVTGIIGLVVMTVIEMRLEPWRFMDEE
jgi:hypothetical protein